MYTPYNRVIFIKKTNNKNDDDDDDENGKKRRIGQKTDLLVQRVTLGLNKGIGIEIVGLEDVEIFLKLGAGFFGGRGP